MVSPGCVVYRLPPPSLSASDTTHVVTHLPLGRGSGLSVNLRGGECQWNFRNSAAELRTFVRGVQRGVPRSVMRSSTSNFTLPGVDFLIGVRTLYRESPRGVFVDFTWSTRCFGADFALAQLSIHVKPMKTTGVWRRVRRLPCGVLLFPRGVQVETWSSHSPAGIPHFCCGIRTLRTFHVEPSWNSTFQCGIQLEFHFSIFPCVDSAPSSHRNPLKHRGLHVESTKTPRGLSR